MNNEKHLSRISGKEFLQRAFESEQVCLASDLESSNRITHAGDRGEVNEKHFINVLRRYLPNRYTIDKASVLDSKGMVSDSIDIVIYDRQYTPALLDNNEHRYVPAEAVYAIFECKPTINKTYLEYAAEKAASVRKLYRTSVGIPHAGGKYKAKPHFRIIAGIVALKIDWKDHFGDSFQKIHKGLQGNHLIDCGLAVGAACFDVFENEYTLGPKNNALIFFLFRLLNKLQSLGTVPAIDWNAYALKLSEMEVINE